MRWNLFTLSLLVAATAMPATAQVYSDACRDVRGGRQAAGAVLGAIAGGLVGNGVAANKNRDEGALLGAVVGAVAGSQIGRAGNDCAPTVYGSTTAYPTSSYGPSAPYYDSSAYSREYSSYPYGSGDGYWRGGGEYDRGYDARGNYPQRKPYKKLDTRHSREYEYNSDFAGRECADAKQITRLPDGTEIHRPVEACRTARYGDWHVED
jgi:Zn-finger nucleic acid-binding protein